MDQPGIRKVMMLIVNGENPLIPVSTTYWLTLHSREV